MPSSTSSFDAETLTREVPERPWLSMFAGALVLAAVVMVGWELRVRAEGYGPAYDDTVNLWVTQRKRAEGARADQVVFVGASRTLFDANLDVFQQEMGGPAPIQLATVGSNPLIILEDLAEDPTYAGTTIVGVVPGLLAAAAGPPVANPTAHVKKYHKWSVADAMEFPLTLGLQETFAFLNQDELTLSALIDSMDLPLRTGVYSPKLPGYLHTVDLQRQGTMLPSVTKDSAIAKKVQQIWLPLFKGPPKPSLFTEEQWGKLLSDGWESNLKRLIVAVEKINARGGKVLFSRWPSTGEVRELERRGTPKVAFWDRILRETGQKGIHFEDYPELQGFDCPEWSHLNGEDAKEYTRRFAQIIKREGLL